MPRSCPRCSTAAQLYLSLIHILAFPCENYGLSAREIRERTDAAIEALQLSHLKDRAVDVLSSGEKQRAAIASVYAMKPKVFVCDEPTANLDAAGTRQLAQTLRQLKGNYATWKQGGGIPGDGTSPLAASPDFLLCLSSVLRPPYGCLLYTSRCV